MKSVYEQAAARGEDLEASADATTDGVGPEVARLNACAFQTVHVAELDPKLC